MAEQGLAASVRLRDVRLDDADSYLRWRCDPAMTAETGGPLSPADARARLVRDVASAANGATWNKIIEVGPRNATAVAGTVLLWTNEDDGREHSEMGWMVLPEFQRQGVASTAVGLVVELAVADGRWGVLEAVTSLTNRASHGVCRRVGFHWAGTEPLEVEDDRVPCHLWRFDTAVVPR